MSFDYLGALIRSYRQANKESLQSLANRSGVSRSMIAHIESNQTSPTLNTLAKLADAMNIRIGDLVTPPRQNLPLHIYQASSDNLVSGASSTMSCHRLYQGPGGVPECYQFCFRRYGKTAFAANSPGRRKYLWLQQGSLTLYLAAESVQLQAGQLLPFDASRPHRFECRQGVLAEGIFWINEEGE